MFWIKNKDRLAGKIKTNKQTNKKPTTASQTGHSLTRVVIPVPAGGWAAGTGTAPVTCQCSGVGSVPAPVALLGKAGESQLHSWGLYFIVPEAGEKAVQSGGSTSILAAQY